MITTRFSTLVPSKLAIGLAILPLAIPVTYLLYLDRVVSARLSAVTGVRDKTRHPASDIPPGIPKPVSLPEEVRADEDGSEWVLACERVVSQPLALVPPPSSSPSPSPSPSPSAAAAAALPDLVTRYVRATMAAFSRTPQAWLLWASIGGHDDDDDDDGGAEARRTFGGHFIRGLAFRPGDRVNGFWTVAYRGDGGSGMPGLHERVEMALDPPRAYHGVPAVVRGIVVAGLETRGEDGRVVFVNETWMWRRQGEEAPLLLERPLGRWLHAVLAGWLVMKGLAAVSEKGRVSLM